MLVTNSSIPLGRWAFGRAATGADELRSGDFAANRQLEFGTAVGSCASSLRVV